MENRKNELELVEGSFSKKILRIVALLCYILYAVVIFNIISDFNKFTKNEKISNVITIVIFIIFTVIIINKIINKNGRKSMSVMKDFCSYKDLYRYLENEEFKELSSCGIESIAASKLWLKTDGVFIPKNFISGAYIHVATHGVYELRFILINGKQYFYRIGSDKNKIERTLNSVKDAVPHFQLYNDVFRENKDIFNRAKVMYEKKLKAGLNMQELINKWTGEFKL